MRKPILFFTLMMLIVFVTPVVTFAEEVTAAKTTTPPNINGTVAMGEWDGAALITIAAPVFTEIKLKTFHDADPMNPQETIFMLVTVTDSSAVGGNDRVQIWLDTFNGGGLAGEYIGFEIFRDPLIQPMRRITGNFVTQTITPGWVPGPLQFAHVAAPPAGTWQFEVKIVASEPDLNVAFLPAVMKMMIYVKDAPTGMGATNEDFWPAGVDTQVSSTWADLKTRLPIEFMMVLDQSGSMITLGRWTSAKRAANLMANTLFALKDAGFVDKLGMVNFKSNCASDVDTTSLEKPLNNVPGVFPGDYMSGIADPLSSNCTPIGKGLDMAFEGGAGTLLVNSQPNKQAERIVLLLSDGFHNSPPANVPLLPSHLAYDPCPNAAQQTNPVDTWSPCINTVVSRVKVNTVALGSDASVDVDLLTKIKNRFSGVIAPPVYNIADVGETGALMDHFIGTLDDLFQVNSLTPGSPFTLNPSERKLIVILTWHTATDADLITLTRGGNPVPCDTTNFSDAAGFSICIVNNPQSGSYTANVPNLPERQFNLVDLHLAANFAIDKQLHGTGQDLVLSARLNEAGVPVTNTGAHPVNVTVSIKRPTEGFGTYVAVHEPPVCTAAPPKLPPLDDNPQTPTGIKLPPIPPPLVVVSGNEPKPARFVKIDQLFASCGKTTLNFTEEPGTPMFDDGTHGDVTANDGIYTLRIQDAQTQFEGSYSFRFRAEGKSPSGSDFTRRKTIGEYVRVNVDPGASPIDSRVLQQTGTTIVNEYYVTPKDRFGGYLGPGHSDQVVFTTTAGTFVTPVIDYNNGIYSRVLQFNSATEDPVVGGTVQGKPLDPVSGDFGSGQGFEFFPYVGGSAYQNSLGLNNGFTVGARFGYRFPNQFALEAEGGVTFTRFNFGPNIGQRAKLIQVLGNLRYDIDQWGSGNFTPYVIAGAGGVFLRGAGSNDSAFAVHTGFGSTWRLTNHVGIRADGRVFRLGSLNGAPATNSFQFNAGVVFRF